MLLADDIRLDCSVCVAIAEAAEEQVSPDRAQALAGERVGDHLHDPGTARPVGLDVFWLLSRPKVPEGVPPVAFLVIPCLKRDLVLQAWL